MINIRVTTNAENKEYLDSKVEFESDNSTFQEYVTAIIAIIEKIRILSPEITTDTLLSLIHQYYEEKEKD